MDSESNQAFIEFLDDPSKEVQITITDSVMRESGFSSYAAYVIKVSHPIAITVERRYRQFFALREVMLARWPGVYIPFLPPKYISGNSDLKVVSERVKYLSYFLNCVAKVSYLFMSDQFQLFLTSNNSDLKKVFQKMQKPTFESIVVRYSKIFLQIEPNLDIRTELMLKANGEIAPFSKELQTTQSALNIIKKQLFKLATRRQEYLRSLGDLYSDALPEFEKYIGSTCQTATLVLNSDPVLRQKIATAKVSRAQNYWIIYQAIRLQIGQSKAVQEVVQKRLDLQRQQQRIHKKIVTNDEELLNIKNKKTSLRTFFNANSDELARQLTNQNQFLQKQLSSISILIIYVNELMLRCVIRQFKDKRKRVWKRAYRQLIAGEQELNFVFADFFKMISLL